MKENKNSKIVIVIAIVAVIIVVVFACVKFVVIPANNYNSAVASMAAGNYDEAIAQFQKLGNYKDAKQQVENARLKKMEDKYAEGLSLFNEGKYTLANKCFAECEGYEDADLYKAYGIVANAVDKISSESGTVDASELMTSYSLLISNNNFNNASEFEKNDIIAMLNKMNGTWKFTRFVTFTDGWGGGPALNEKKIEIKNGVVIEDGEEKTITINAGRMVIKDDLYYTGELSIDYDFEDDTVSTIGFIDESYSQLLIYYARQ